MSKKRYVVKLTKREREDLLALVRLGDVTQEEIDFLKAEFGAPLDVRDFAWSVPLGLEQQVYGFSLMAIGLDEQKEATYLRELAHGLRLQPDVCNQIHEQVGAPQIFR